MNNENIINLTKNTFDNDALILDHLLSNIITIKSNKNNKSLSLKCSYIIIIN